MHLQTTSKTVAQEITITRADILAMARERFEVPDNAEITVRVPGGGDWSHTNLDIDDDEQAIKVRFTERSTSPTH